MFNFLTFEFFRAKNQHLAVDILDSSALLLESKTYFYGQDIEKVIYLGNELDQLSMPHKNVISEGKKD